MASWKQERLTWATGVSLVAPLEVRNERELAAVALLARRLLLGQTTLASEFPGYRYRQGDWLREQVQAPCLASNQAPKSSMSFIG